MKKSLRILLGALLLITGSWGLVAQDMHFSQFYASPLTLNPGLTGLFDGKYRVSAIYRNQWGGPFRREAFKTFSVGMDVNFPLKRSNDFFAGGLMFYSDKVGSGSFNTTQVALSGSYYKALDQYGKSKLGAGFQAGILQRNVNYQGLSFDDQFNGVDGYTLGTNEALPRNSFAISDMAVGVFYLYQMKKQSNLYAGVSLHHFHRPKIMFGTDQDTIINRLYMKTTVQLGGQFRLGDQHSKVLMQPRLVAFLQGPHLELNAGSNFRIAVTPYGFAGLHLGAWARPVKNANGFGLDSAVLLAGFDFHGLIMGFSFDLNLTDLAAPGPKRTGFEISVSYIGDYDSDAVACPTF